MTNKARVEKNHRGQWTVYLPVSSGYLSPGYEHQTWRDAIRFAAAYMRFVR